GGSSPSARLSLQRERARASIRLDLDHAPEEVTPRVNDTDLVNPRKALPDKCRTIFPYELFNVVQSKCFPHVYGSDDNVVVSAPTGSGKTAILELAICRLITTHSGMDYKIVYQAPTKSLCSERARDWEKKFSHMNLQCVELTGDTSHAETKRVGSASIIVTTPEKWDSVTRKWSDHHKLLKMVRLILIDEVHILKDARGATLEAVVSRMKTSGADVRFVALSATVPNIRDIAAWLGRSHSNTQESAHWESFGEDLRPVKLRKFVYGYKSGGNEFMFDSSLDARLQKLLRKHAEGKPTMVFCFTRKSCEQTARKLAEWWAESKAEEKAWPAPTGRIPVISKDLLELVRFGVAFHHAGLDPQDRAAVETNFLNGQLHVICCTSTLAVGVNLPCHTVVLKGTVAYTDDGLQEYSDLEVMQMLGRAGRPQFDRSAVAIIMTRHENIERYDKMISGEEVLESTLHLNLVEHLNSEIGLGTIKDLKAAKKWISGTFLSVRMRKAPGHYEEHGGQAAVTPDERIQQWCERDIQLLQDYGLITKGDRFKCTEYGNAMSRYMVQFDTMKQLLSIPRSPSMEQLVLYPIHGPLTDTWHKVSIMAQVHLGALALPNDKENSVLKRDIAIENNLIFDRMNRLVRCFIDCKVFDGDAIGTRVGLELARAIAAGSWDGQPSQLLQIPGIGPAGLRKLVASGVRSVYGFIDMGSEGIERVMSRNPPYGRNLLTKHLNGFPRLTMNAEIIGPLGADKRNNTVSVALKVRLGYSNRTTPLWRSKSPAVTLLVGTTDGNLANFWRNNIKSVANGLDLTFPVILNRPDESLTCYYSCEEVVGTQVTQTLKPNLPASVLVETQNSQQRHNPQSRQLPVLDEDLDDDGLADEDMLDVVNDYEDFPNIKDILEDDEFDYPRKTASQTATPQVPPLGIASPRVTSVQVPYSQVIPSQMANGKWTCNHHCRDGGLTKSGKQCSHRCCHEGLDRPSRPKKRKPDAEGHKVAPTSASSRIPTGENSRIHASASRRNSHGDHPTNTPPTRDVFKGAKRPKLKDQSTCYDQDGVECIDLSVSTDEESDI
ncbi:uncharacterized protein BCR38DRAFT_316781, partial [Pseudomassariella vexata]